MDGIDGMETARKLRSQNDKGYLIFITVLKEMVFQSFEVQAYDYLIKPINEECFEKTMGRLYASMQNANDAKVLYEDPKKVPKTKDVKAEEKPAKKAEKCTTNTDNVDREIEKLKEDKTA